MTAQASEPATIYASPAAVLKSPTAYSLLQLEPGTECPICMSKIVSIESLGAYGWRCSCAGCYVGEAPTQSYDATDVCPQADSIEQAVERWLEEIRECAEELQDVRCTVVPTSLGTLYQMASRLV